MDSGCLFSWYAGPKDDVPGCVECRQHCLGSVLVPIPYFTCGLIDVKGAGNLVAIALYS